MSGVSFWDRLRRASEGARLEESGDLEAAVEAYRKEDRGADAARVLSSLADGVADPRERLRLVARARRMVPDASEAGRALALRHARMRLDLARGASSTALPSELAALGEELSRAGDALGAAEAFRLAGDHAGEARVLVEHGEVDAVESTLETGNAAARSARRRRAALDELTALEVSGQRIRALELAAKTDGDEARDAARAIAGRLARPPSVRLEALGITARWLVDETIVLGRHDADVVVASPLVSRRHLRFARGDGGGATIEALGAANGTVLAGARLAGTIPIRGPLALSLGGEVPCLVAPHPSGIAIEVGGATTIATLGPARIGPFVLRRTADAFRLVSAPGGPPPILGRATVPEGVDLSVGDEIRAERGGPLLVRVLA